VSPPETALSSDINNRQIAVWLLACCAIIFTMVVLGGVTRLTRSGLSMVEWEPIMGVIPPLSQGAWTAAFEKYRQFPEYQKINRGMTLGEFKSIYLVEYAHRVLGRTIGLVFLIPFLYFFLKGKISRPLVPKLVAMFVLGALQGLLGWYMVKSGLVGKPHVSQYRLTAHLIAAFAIYAYIFWAALGLLFPVPANTGARSIVSLRHFGLAITSLVVIAVISGGFVAGTKAGFAFNTFPLMSGRLIPEGIFALKPWWTNLFDNVATVQFNHRGLAVLLSLAIPGFWLWSRRFGLSGRTRNAFYLLLGILAIQVTLGITTLLYIVPVSLAAAHQAGALLLFTNALFINYELR